MKQSRNPGTEAARLLNKVGRVWTDVCGGGKLALGLSGGMDSVLLCEAAFRCGIPLVAFHFNHRWRGSASAADARWVEKWCAKRKIPLVQGKALEAGMNSEGRAREERWSFYIREAKKRRIGCLWLAQHGDDLVETFLLQLLRGAGPEGLAGLQELREREGVKIVRPLLDFDKKTLEEVARSWKLDWREDPSNLDLAMFRNRVRRKLIPYLEKMARRPVRKQIWRTARLLADENLYWENEIPPDPPAELPLSIRQKPVAWQRRYLRNWLKSRNVPDLGFELIEKVRGLLTDMSRHKVNLPGERHCRRRSGKLWIE